MKPDLYKALKNYAHECFEETHAGLYTLIHSDKNFVDHVEKKYRLNQYQQEGNFFMTANERWFHLIGFIDALIWFYRGDLLKDSDTLKQELIDAYYGGNKSPDQEYIADYKLALEIFKREQTILDDCILCYEFGEDE